MVRQFQLPFDFPYETPVVLAEGSEVTVVVSRGESNARRERIRERPPYTRSRRDTPPPCTPLPRCPDTSPTSCPRRDLDVVEHVGSRP